MSDDSPDLISELQSKPVLRNRGGQARVVALNTETDVDGSLVATVSVRRPPAGHRMALTEPRVEDLPSDIHTALWLWAKGQDPDEGPTP